MGGRFLTPSVYDAVIFDNDGVLVELSDRAVLRDAAERAFERVGVSDPDPEHVESMVVGVTPETLSTVCSAYDIDTEEFWRVRDRAAAAVQRAEIESGRVGLYEDFSVVRDLSLPRGIVSSNQRETIEFMLDHFDTRTLFDSVHARDPTVESLHRKKPNPHYLQRAITDLGVERPLFVGDSESDVRAAHNAGVDSAFLRRPHRDGHELGVEPTYEFDSLTDLLDVPGVSRTRESEDAPADAGGD